MLQNEYLDAKIGVATAENEPSKVCLSCLYFVSIWSTNSCVCQYPPVSAHAQSAEVTERQPVRQMGIITPEMPL